MYAGESDGGLDVIWNFEWIGNFGSVGRTGELDRFGVILVVNEIIALGLVFSDVSFSI